MLNVEVIFFDRQFIVFPSYNYESIPEDIKRITGKSMEDVREMFIRA
jgi:hypothetical protein